MASVNGWDFASTTPGHLGAYCREQIGWIEPIVIAQDGYYALQALELSNQAYRIDHGYPTGEYLLIENKQPVKWDMDVVQGGIVIYHIDANADRQVDNSWPGKSTWPKSHYRVAVQQADRTYVRFLLPCTSR
jgi:hypothetical protein